MEHVYIWTVSIQISIAVLNLSGTGDPPNTKHQGYFTSLAACTIYVGKHWREIANAMPIPVSQKNIFCKRREATK